MISKKSIDEVAAIAIGLDDIKSQAWENLKRDNPPSFKTIVSTMLTLFHFRHIAIKNAP